MRHTNKILRSGVHAACWMAVSVGTALAQDRGTLVVNTNPDSAIVVLDDSKDAERQRTPFSNENMIPGTHSVLLRPSNQAFKSATFDVAIEAGQTSTIEHTFEYRTKAFGMEHLSIAPWKFEVATGIEGRRYIGFQSSQKNAAGVSLSNPSYGSDSVPNSLYFPTEFRLGFPGGWEAHFEFPVGAYAAPKDTSSEFVLSDPGMGVKWVYAPFNSGLDLTWTFGNTKSYSMSALADAFTITAITDQKWAMLDLSANLGASFRMSRLSNEDIDVGDQFFAKVRAGILLADRFMPYAMAAFQYTLPDDSSGKDATEAGYQGTITPGFVWYIGKDVSLEAGIPLTLLASNAQTSWGGNLSLAVDFSLAGKAGKSVAKKGAALSAYPLQTPGVPVTSPTNILFDSKEVSNAEYKEFCDKTGREYPADPEFSGMPGYFTDPKTANYPVVKISIDDARAYAAWVGKRLPTVTEWRKEIESANIATAMLACGLETPEPVGTRHQGSGLYHFVGNVAEWVENDRKVGSVAYIAGGFFTLPRERCMDKSRWIDVASPAGAKYIGVRLVTEVK
jgi:hypothetical protein